MEIKKYEVLVKTAELQSLTEAAKELGITQSGVSHILANLEEHFGFPLLIRSRAGARLTPDGERLLPLIHKLLACSERIESTAVSIRGLSAGTIRIGTFTSVAVHWLPGIMKEFQTDYPQIEFRLFNGDYYDVDRWLDEEEVDLAFVAYPPDADCDYQPLFKDRLLAILPPGHHLADRERFPLREVEHEPFISLLKGSDHDARRALAAAGVRPDIKFTTKDDYAIIAMVEQGLGISIMPELLLAGRTDGVCVRELDPPASRTIALAIPAPLRANPAVFRFTEYVRRWITRQYGKIAEPDLSAGNSEGRI
ncbi:MAG: LysR family transcriptional regulator [Clostridiaceae bacterium]|nr:LysR family transcriptional regulator [Clostridiaceae bacterium]